MSKLMFLEWLVTCILGTHLDSWSWGSLVCQIKNSGLCVPRAQSSQKPEDATRWVDIVYSRNPEPYTSYEKVSRFTRSNVALLSVLLLLSLMNGVLKFIALHVSHENYFK